MGKYSKKNDSATNRTILYMLIVCLFVLVFFIAIFLMFFSKDTPKKSEPNPVETQEQIMQTQPFEEKEELPEEDELPENVQTLPTHPELTLESVEEEGQSMVITTSYCVLQYPFTFSDLIRVSTVNQADQTAIMFYAYLIDSEYPMFSILFDSTEGNPVGTLCLSDGTTVSVTMQLFHADDSMDSNMLQTFYAAQETINDVINSLMDAEGFIPA